MPTRQQLESALRNADKAGDTEAAKKLANALKSGQYAQKTQPVADSKDDGFSATEMVKNIPSSALGIAEDVYQAVRHPVETTKGLAGAVGGMSQQANDSGLNAGPLSLLGKALDYLGVDYRQYGDAVMDAINNRYGSIDAAVNTLEQDPVGALVDLSGVLSGAGTLTGSKALTTAGAAVNPVNATANTVKYTAGKMVPEGLPSAMYENAAKFSTAKNKDDRKRSIQTALDKGIMPTTKGVDKLQGLVDDFNHKIDSLIEVSSQGQATVPAKTVFKHVKELRRRYGNMNLDSPSDVKTINKLAGEFAKELRKKGKNELTARELQELKVNTYKRINFDANAQNITSSQAGVDTRKAVARGAKEGVEDLVPDAKAINKELSDLYNLQEPLIRASNRIENKNFISITDTPQIGVAGGAGGFFGGASGAAIGTAIGTLAAILGKDNVKAFNAIQLNRIAKDAELMQFLKNNPGISQAEVMAIIASRHPTEEDQQ